MNNLSKITQSKLEYVEFICNGMSRYYNVPHGFFLDMLNSAEDFEVSLMFYDYQFRASLCLERTMIPDTDLKSGSVTKLIVYSMYFPFIESDITRFKGKLNLNDNEIKEVFEILEQIKIQMIEEGYDLNRMYECADRTHVYDQNGIKIIEQIQVPLDLG